MNKNNAIVVGAFATIAVIGFLGLITAQLVFAQDVTTSATEDLKTMITAITGIISTIAALAGGIIASFARMSQKLGLAKEGEIEKMLVLSKELENSDQWCRQLDERLVAVADVISTMPEGKKYSKTKEST